MGKNEKNPRKKLNILFVTEFYDESRTDFSGGVEARTHHLVDELRKYHDVHVISRKREKVAAHVSSFFSRLWFQISAIIGGLKHKPDLVEGSNFVCYIPAFIIAKLTGAKAVMWSADPYGKTWFRTMSFPVALAGYFLEWVGMHLPFDGYIAMSKVTKKKLVSAGVPKEKIEVIYGGVDIQAIQSIAAKKYKMPSIIAVCRLVNYKRVDDLIRAFSQVQHSVGDAQLYIAGDGPERQALEILSTSITTNNSVHFLGTISQHEVWKYMKKCHVFCLPSEVEGFGLVTVEAIAAGLPFVSSDIPATREVTRNALGGVLVPVGKVGDYSKNISKLLCDKDLYSKKVDEVASLQSLYDVKRTSQDSLSFYKHLANKHY